MKRAEASRSTYSVDPCNRSHSPCRRYKGTGRAGPRSYPTGPTPAHLANPLFVLRWRPGMRRAPGASWTPLMPDNSGIESGRSSWRTPISLESIVHVNGNGARRREGEHAPDRARLEVSERYRPLAIAQVAPLYESVPPEALWRNRADRLVPDRGADSSTFLSRAGSRSRPSRRSTAASISRKRSAPRSHGRTGGLRSITVFLNRSARLRNPGATWPSSAGFPPRSGSTTRSRSRGARGWTSGSPPRWMPWTAITSMT
jgi:hypothetical protein